MNIMRQNLNTRLNIKEHDSYHILKELTINNQNCETSKNKMVNRTQDDAGTKTIMEWKPSGGR